MTAPEAIPVTLKVGNKATNPVRPIRRGSPWSLTVTIPGRADLAGTWKSDICTAWDTVKVASATVTATVEGDDLKIVVSFTGTQSAAFTRHEYRQDLIDPDGNCWFRWAVPILGRATT